nr:MAG TPA: hypothetical protein [Bacteriophage sp.]
MEKSLLKALREKSTLDTQIIFRQTQRYIIE